MLELICKELGVEFGEEWKNNVGDTYKITEEGLFYMFSDGDWEEVSNKGYKMLLKNDGVTIYEQLVYTGKIELPEILKGIYQIQFIKDNICFYGYINL